ncbi:MAG: ABC transporter permease [Candidatus Competibacteraceae bacterium]|nr:ABC transporter permease [Candidatus Competibacteraceae bacterium]MCB1805501.1 ABC transporter permease [Candidatus Competibacteraceae bacterium]MCB1811576.1 ABC transporter permease [Candidatus Competibacteraceae bacterium]
MTAQTRIFLSVIYWAFVVYLFVPLLLMITMGFKDSRFIGFPIKAWTLNWYAEVFRDTEVLGVFAFSMTIALASTLLSLFIGVWVATFLGPNRFRGKLLVFALTCLPAVIPGIISAISLRIFARLIELEPGMLAIILGHTVHNVPFVALVIMARLSTLPPSQLEAARDLGADSLIAFMRVTLPYLRPALIGAGVFCMLLSFDDFVRSFFLGGYEPTLPVLIFAKLRSGMSPEINAISTVVLILTAILGLWAERSMRRLERTS